MKVLHCCLAAFYIDDFGYQENVLPKIHRMHGHDVKILASTETYLTSMKLGYVEASSYISSDNIPVTRLAYQKWLPHKVISKLRLYKGLKKEIIEFQPDVIFMHDCQFLSISAVKDYAKKNKVEIYVDCHTDLINSAKGLVSRNILHGIIYKYCAKLIEPFVTRFYGTLPLRNEFLHEVYGITKEKIGLLPFGTDDTLFKTSEKAFIRKEMRQQLGLEETDLVIVTGGKIDLRKNIHVLMEAVLKIAYTSDKVKLLLFGKPTVELKEFVDKMKENPTIIYKDWVDSKEIYKYFLCADLGFFPGTHSVLWEEATGLGLPCVFKRWHGIEHVDLGGNCMFLDVVTEQVIIETINRLIDNNALFDRMRSVAQLKGPKEFSYTEIAKRALNSDYN
ncbi:glycosyltransferase family 4 protein [Roseivirga sp.]|uniref:glycosyltransferase family 4 protein n=1 Tax=Roseivirga sp. TaxID=1964215 RepID=UPI003B51F616